MSSSQRVLKCTVCGGDHSRLHCLVICNSCSGDKRRCNCKSGPPQKKRTKKARSETKDPEPDYEKLHSMLVQCHERVGQAFQALKTQNDELAAELEEKNREIEELNSDAQELADLVKTKEKVIEDLNKSLVAAKNRISAMQEEIRSLQASDAAAVEEEPEEQTTHRVSSHNLESIHERYNRVLEILREEHCSMANAFRLARCPRSTIRDFVAIAELKIVDAREHELVTRDHSGSVQQLELVCRKHLRRYQPMMAAMRRESRLLPLKFGPRFYE
ncbi:uncharacterized protein [Montipora foliosa]|uniref:uncharacterized protein n=1 Tax=Montipora foliosa TaxID=591990 RepID=UPI0035F1BB31